MENPSEACRSELLKIFEDLGKHDLEKAKDVIRAMGIPWGTVERLNSPSNFANTLLSYSDSVNVCRDRVKAILIKIPRQDLTLRYAYFFTDLNKKKSEDVKQKCEPHVGDPLWLCSGSGYRTIQQLSGRVRELETKIDHLTSASNSSTDRVNNFQGNSTLAEVRGHYDDCQNAKVNTNHEVARSLQILKQNQLQLESTISHSREIVDLLKHQVTCYSMTMNNLQSEMLHDKGRFNSIEGKLKELENNTALKSQDFAKTNARISSLESVSYDGVLLWKIDDFSRKKQEAICGKSVSINSHCFYSSRHGYKMCARIYLNGDGNAKGSHVSLFFVIMKGPYDAILKWPFPFKVTMTWIDQGNKHRTDVKYSFQPNPESCSFKRPTSDENFAVGCPAFMPLSRLYDQDHGYIKDDAAFVKVTVDTCPNVFKNFILFRILGFIPRSSPQNEESAKKDHKSAISYSEEKEQSRHNSECTYLSLQELWQR